MKNYFRYGYDPWMIGMTIVILIVEALGFFLGGENTYDPFANIPFWLLTLYIISMIAMFLTACFIKNNAFQEERGFYKQPLNFVAIGILVLAIYCFGICIENLLSNRKFLCFPSLSHIGRDFFLPKKKLDSRCYVRFAFNSSVIDLLLLN